MRNGVLAVRSPTPRPRTGAGCRCGSVRPGARPKAACSRCGTSRTPRGLARNAAFEAAQRFEAELGYGIAGRRRNSLWVPFIAAQAADGGGQALQMGVRLASESSLEAELRLGRRQDLQGVPKHAVELRASMRW